MFEEIGLDTHQEVFGSIVGGLDSIRKKLFRLVKDDARPQPEVPRWHGRGAPADVFQLLKGKKKIIPLQ